MRHRIKKLLCVVLTLITVFAAMPIYASAATSGTCGANSKWSYDKNSKTLKITGSKTDSTLVANYKSYKDTPWYDNEVYVFPKNVRISELAVTLNISGVRTVGTNSFSNMSSVTNAAMDSNIRYINAGAFSSDKKLNTVKMPAVTIIRDSAFENCSALRNVNMPAVESIGANAFKNTGLTSVTLPSTLKHIGANAFAGCPNLVVSCVKGSYADSYCIANNIKRSYTNALALDASLNESGKTIDIKISLKGSKGFEGGNFELKYDSAALAPVVKEELSASGITCFADYAAAGVVKLSAYSDSDITSDSVNIATISFKAKTQADSANFSISAYNMTVSGNDIDYESKSVNGFGLHSYKASVVPPTCTSKGYTKHECYFCTKNFSDSEMPMIDHSYVTVSEQAPACTKDGLKTEKCSMCGEIKKTTLTKLGHSYTDTVVPPTCKDKGYTLHTCVRGDHSYKDNYVNADASKHVMTVSKEVPATCTKDGYRIEICSVCKKAETQKKTVLPKTGHSYTQTGYVAPTCTKDGLKTETCSVCGNVRKTTLTKLGHSYTDTVVPPTCKDKGYTLHTCVRGDHSYKDSYVNADASKHVMTVSKEVAPTCTKDGYRIEICSVCKKAETQKKTVLPKTGHSYTQTGYVAPTCTKDGLKTETCSVCGNVKKTTLKALGHNYVDTAVPPTCTQKGYTIHVCSVCSYSYKDSYTDVIAHSYVDTVVDPTCTQKGYTIHICSVCGESYTDSYTDMIPHSYEKDITEATCTADGKCVYTCSVCGDTYEETIKSAGHIWDSGNIIRPATPTRDGIMEYTCTVCGEKRTEKISKTNPDTDPDDPKPTPTPDDPTPTPSAKLEIADGVENVTINDETKMILIIAPSTSGIKYSELGVLFKTAPVYTKSDDDAVCTGDTVTSGSDSYTVAILGDVNFDGRITAADARIVLRVSAKLDASDDKIVLAGDLNGNGKLSAAEARTILRYSAKLEASLK